MQGAWTLRFVSAGPPPGTVDALLLRGAIAVVQIRSQEGLALEDPSGIGNPERLVFRVNLPFLGKINYSPGDNISFGPISGMTRALHIVVFTFLLIGMAGCGSSPTALVPVEGRVWVKGQLLLQGTVVFVPDEEKGHNGKMATASIEPGGVYRLSTEKSPGAEPGWYKVTVASGEMLGASRVAKKYSDPTKSGLVKQVQPGVPNSIDIHLD